MDKKAQGISLNFIVIAIIAALVLIIIIAFTVGGLGTALSKIFQAGEQSTDADLDLAKADCEKLCNNAKQIDSPNGWEMESYCKKTYTFEGNQPVNCWEEPIRVDCSTSGYDVYDASWSCDQDVCEEPGCSEITCHNCIDGKAQDDDGNKICSAEALGSNSKCDEEQGDWEQ